MLRTIVDSPLSTRYAIDLFILFDLLFCPFHLLEVAGILLLIDIVGIFRGGEGSKGSLGDKNSSDNPVDQAHNNKL